MLSDGILVLEKPAGKGFIDYGYMGRGLRVLVRDATPPEDGIAGHREVSAGDAVVPGIGVGLIGTGRGMPIHDDAIVITIAAHRRIYAQRHRRYARNRRH